MLDVTCEYECNNTDSVTGFS